MNTSRIYLSITAATITLVLGINFYTLSQIDTEIIEAIEKNEDIKLTFRNKNLLSKSLDYRIQYASHPIDINVSPAYFSQSFSYKVSGIDEMINKELSLTKEQSIKTDIIQGTYHLNTTTNQLQIKQLSLPSPLGVVSLKRANIAMKIPLHEAFQINHFLELDVADFAVSDILTLPQLTIESDQTAPKTLTIRTKVENFMLHAEPFINFITPIIGADILSEDLFLIFPYTLDMAINANYKLIDLLSGQGQDLSEEANAGMRILTTTPVFYSQLRMFLGLKPNEDDFDAGVSVTNDYSTSNIDIYNRFMQAVANLSAAFGQPVPYIDLNLIEEKGSIKASGRLTTDGVMSAANLVLSTQSVYTPNEKKETVINFSHDNLPTLSTLTPYFKINGEFLTNETPEALTKVASIKTNHPQRLAGLIETLYASNQIKEKLNALAPDDIVTLELYVG